MRRKRFFLSVGASFYKQAAFIILGLILPRLIMEHYGSAVNGLVNSITQFLGYISMLELGFSAVVSSSLYGPLAQKDELEISKVIQASKNFFKKIAMLTVLYSIILVFIYPVVINSQFDFVFIATLIIAIAINLFVQYYFGISNIILLNADQRAYIPYIVNGTTALLNVVISILLIKADATIQTVKLATSLIYIARPIVFALYIKKNYNIQKNVKYEKNPIKNRTSGIAQHIAFGIFKNTDIGVLTIFSTLENVSVYSVYNYIIDAVVGILENVLGNVTALMGDMLSSGENNRLITLFDVYVWLLHLVSTIVFSVTSYLIVSFVGLYTSGIKDANYIVPEFAAILTIAYATYIIRLPYNQMIIAAGHYKETQIGSIIEAVLNIVLSVLLVSRYGLVGIAVGTLVAMLWRTLYLAWYLSKNILLIPLSHLFKNIMVDLFIICIYYCVCPWLMTEADSYIIWIKNALVMTMIFACIAIGVNMVFNRHHILQLINYLKKSSENYKRN